MTVVDREGIPLDEDHVQRPVPSRSEPTFASPEDPPRTSPWRSCCCQPSSAGSHCSVARSTLSGADEGARGDRSCTPRPIRLRRGPPESSPPTRRSHRRRRAARAARTLKPDGRSLPVRMRPRRLRADRAVDGARIRRHPPSYDRGACAPSRLTLRSPAAVMEREAPRRLEGQRASPGKRRDRGRASTSMVSAEIPPLANRRLGAPSPSGSRVCRANRLPARDGRGASSRAEAASGSTGAAGSAATVHGSASCSGRETKTAPCSSSSTPAFEKRGHSPSTSS